MPDPDRRPLTAEERRVLADLPPPPSAVSLLWDVALGSCVAVGCLGLLTVLVIASTLALLSPGLRGSDAFRATAILSALGGSIAVSAVVTAVRFPRERSRRADQHRRIRADLEGGVAAIERHRARDAIRAILMEHRERAFFVLLEDGRAMYLGYWNPPDDDNPSGRQDLPPEGEGFPSTEFELARAPASGVVVGIRGCGQPLRPSRTFEVKERFTKPLPAIGDLVRVPWGDITRTYG